MTDPVRNEEATEPTEERESPESGAASQAPTEAELQAIEKELEAELEEASVDADAYEATPPAPALDAELVALREEFENLNDRHLRLAAEFNNYRRRVEQERGDLWGRAQADLVARFLDVLDDLQRVAALDLGNATVEAIMEGIDLVDRKFVRKLTDAGVDVLQPGEGERFDPETMEAMMRIPAETAEEDDTVGQVFQKGYALNGQLIRPARVSVKKHG